MDGSAPEDYPEKDIIEGGSYRDDYVKHLEQEVVLLRHEKEELLSLYKRSLGYTMAFMGESRTESDNADPVPVGGRKSWSEKRAELEKADHEAALLKGIGKGSAK